MINSLNLIIGILGMLCILIAFILEDFRKVHKGGKIYNLLNFFGAILLTIYAFNNNAIVFIILNIFWALIAIYFLVRNK